MRPKVRIGRRVLDRSERLSRAAGLGLSHAVVARTQSGVLPRAKRLVPGARPTWRATAAREPAVARAPAGAGDEGWVASQTESTILPGASDWAADWLFGGGEAAESEGTPWMGAATPAAAAPKKLSRRAASAPAAARTYKVLESGEEPPAPASAAPAAPAAESSPAPAVARSTAEPAAPAPAAAAPAPAPAPEETSAE